MRGAPSIRRLDEVPMEEVVRIEFADGRTASVWDKWIELTPRYFAFWNRWDPGAMAPQHGHTGDHAVFVLKGEIRCGEVLCRAGTHIMLEWGDVFGPWEAGPEGCELYGFIAGDGTPFSGDDASFQELLARRNARMVSLPMPTRVPPWLRTRLATSDVVDWSPAR